MSGQTDNLADTNNLWIAGGAGLLALILYFAALTGVDKYFDAGALFALKEGFRAAGQSPYWWSNALFFGAIGIFVVTAIVTMVLLEKPRSHANTLEGDDIGDEKTLNALEASARKRTGEGIKLGKLKLSRDSETSHILIAGQPKSGKTAGVINSLILQVLDRDQEKVVLYDPKGEFSTWAKPKTGKRILYGPWDKRSAYWLIGRDVYSSAKAREAARDIIKEEKGGNNAHFSNAARAVMAGLIMACIKAKPCPNNRNCSNWMFSDLSALLKLPPTEIAKAAINGMAEEDGLSDLTSQIHFREDGTLSTETSSVISTLKGNTAWIKQVAATEPKTKEELRKRRAFSAKNFVWSKTNDLLILKDDSESEGAAEYLFGMVLRFVQKNVASPKRPEVPASQPGGIWFFFDEYPQLGAESGKSVRKIQEFCRSKGARVVIAFQDMTQLYDAYGKEAGQSQMAMQQIMIFTRLSQRSAKEVSDELGTKHVSMKVKNTSDSNMNQEETYNHQRPIVSPKDLTSIGPTKKGANLLVVAHGQPARVLAPYAKVPPATEPQSIPNPAFEHDIDLSRPHELGTNEEDEAFEDPAPEETSAPAEEDQPAEPDEAVETPPSAEEANDEEDSSRNKDASSGWGF